MTQLDPTNLATKGDVKRMELLLGAVVLVLFIGFLTLLFSVAAMLVQAWGNRQPEYQILVDEISNQQQKIDALYSATSTHTNCSGQTTGGK